MLLKSFNIISIWILLEVLCEFLFTRIHCDSQNSLVSCCKVLQSVFLQFIVCPLEDGMLMSVVRSVSVVALFNSRVLDAWWLLITETWLVGRRRDFNAVVDQCRRHTWLFFSSALIVPVCFNLHWSEDRSANTSANQIKYDNYRIEMI